MKNRQFNIWLLVLTLGGIAVLIGAGFYLTEIDTDISGYLPQDDKVIADAGYIFKHHPIQSEMVVDLGMDTSDPDRLVKVADWVEQRMRQSGLFSRVGTASIQALIPDLMHYIADNLPALFSRKELDTIVLPLLEPAKIDQQLKKIQSQLYHLDAVGQAALIAKDPLALRHAVMAKLANLAPSGKVEIYKGKLLSSDRTHLLIVATPAGSGTDTVLGRRISDLMSELSAELAAQSGTANTVRLTPVGAFRAALDNERIARRDVQKAIFLATFGIALVLLLAFPRPLIGLLAFLPAVAGTAAAFFILALLHDRLSIMALGFGGAIISITIDHGIAYLLFLDRSRTTRGREASNEVWAIGLMAALTTICAFGALFLTGFPVFKQLGQFTALGIAFSFLFVHYVFPLIFPELPPAKPRPLPIRRWLKRLPVAGKRAAFAGLAFLAVMLFFARPEFNVQLTAMNTVSPETRASEQLMRRVWGSAIFNKIYLMSEGDTPAALQDIGDAILLQVEQDQGAGRLASGFNSSMVFPGSARTASNLQAWQSFWTAQRISTIRHALDKSIEMGFSTDAFASFLDSLHIPNPAQTIQPIPEKYHGLMGIVRRSDGSWMQFSTLSPGPEYASGPFHARYHRLARIFDGAYFSQRLGQLLFSTFVKMLAIIGASVAELLLIFFRDARLTVIVLSPVLFALIATLGSLKLLGHALDIPALMLAIIVLGMGIDYALFLVRAFQRYGGVGHPSFQRIQLAVIMASVSTLIGFGVLCSAEHGLLRSAGITSLLGIGYSLIGAFILLPPLLGYHFKRSGSGTGDTAD